MLCEEEIRARLEAAGELDPSDGGPGGEAYVEAMRSALSHAEALGDPGLLFHARLSFTWALRSKSLKNGESDFFGEALPVLRQCLLMWHAEPQLFPESDVNAMWGQLFRIVDLYIWVYPESVQRILRFLDELERHCPPTRRPARYAIDHYRMSAEARRGGLEEVERIWQRIRMYDQTDKEVFFTGRGVREVVMWLRLGRTDRAVGEVAPLAAGRILTKDGESNGDELIVPYLRAGRPEEAVPEHQRTYAKTGMKLNELASHLEFCARTGNEERGLDVMHRNFRFILRKVSSVEDMWTAAAVALLCRRTMEKDRDREWVWPCDCDDPDCDFPVVWSYAALASLMYWDARVRSLEIDELNGTSFQSGRLRDLLGAEPVVDGLPLPPDVAPPRHHAAPPPCAHLPSAAAEDLRGGLEEACSLERPKNRAVRMMWLLQSALAEDDREAVPRIRLALLAELMSLKGWRFNLFSTLVELARLYDADPSSLDADGLDTVWRAVPVALDRVLTLPTVHAAQIRGLLRTLEPHCRTGADDLHHLRWFAAELEVRRGDPDAAQAAWKAFDVLPPAEAYATRAHLLRRVQWWFDLGLDDEAAALLSGGLPPGPEAPSAEAYLLLSHLRAGRPEEAREIHERTHRTARHPVEVAAHLEFCARTGDLERGKEILLRSLDLFHISRNDMECPIDVLRAQGAAIRFCDRIVASGRDETWTWPADACCPPEDDWSYARFAESGRTEGELFATRWDGLLGTRAAHTLITGRSRP